MDVLQHLKLPIRRLPGQAYNWATNIAGKYNCAQAIVRKVKSLAPCFNMFTLKSCTVSPIIQLSFVGKVFYVNEF